MSDLDILGVVLAGGGSRRLGRDKAALPWTGTTLAQRAAAVLAAALGEVVIAGPAELARAGVEAVADLFPGRGPLAGLHAGLRHAGGRPIFALACDMPFVGVELVRYLAAAAGAGIGAASGAEPRDAGAWVAAGDRGVQPLCGVYAPGCRAAVEERLAAGDLSVMGFLEAIGGVAVAVDERLEFYRPELLLNVNRPDELRQARRLEAVVGGASR